MWQILSGILGALGAGITGTVNNIQNNANNEWQYKMLLQQLLYQRLMNSENNAVAMKNISEFIKR